MEFETKPDDLLIYDESDHILFNNPDKFDSFTSSNPCVCFTATPGGEDKNLEEAVLQHLKLKIIMDQDSNIKL